MSGTKLREVQAKLMRGLLDVVVLQLLRTHPMHGYQLITSIRKSFGVYFGPSTIYPLLNLLEEKGYVKSGWDMNNERPRKVYELTNDGQNTLDFTEDSLELICRKIGINGQSKIGFETEEMNQTSPHHSNPYPTPVRERRMRT
jgi:PadR family transcriptional regulator PadR